jgi:hypothetical protein
MHDLRCEHSTSDPKRCRCTQCGGAKHGIQRPAEVRRILTKLEQALDDALANHAYEVKEVRA